MSDQEVTSALETERKYDVDASAVVPPLAGFRTEGAQPATTLRAIYFDTETGALAAHATTFRRRAGGHDEGWHVKLPGDGTGRVEHHAPLSVAPPSGLLAILRDIVRAPLVEIASITTRRSTTRVFDSGDHQVAEIADDVVTTVDLRLKTERTWREWEVELTAGAPTGWAQRDALLDAIEKSLVASGATPSPYASKLARALGRESLNS